MVHAFSTSRTDYCNSTVWAWPISSQYRMYSNAAIKIILCKRRFDLITDGFPDQLHWLPVQQRQEFKSHVLVRLQQAARTYLAEMCTPMSASTNHSHLHSAACCNLMVPHSRMTRCEQRSFAVSSPTLWNSLPWTVHNPLLTVTQFCVHLKTVLFCKACGTLA